MSRFDLDRATLSSLAHAAGLALAGVSTPAPLDDTARYVVDHVERGHSAGMDWFTAQRARESADPRTLHAEVRSIVSVGVPFWSGWREPPDDDALRGRIARYAWGRDYHQTLRQRMRKLVELLAAHIGRPIEARTLSDTARAFDRALAARSGLGWFGKNSMIIVPRHGSWVMLGELYLDLPIPPDLPLGQNCGRCTICLDHCPTGAIIEPYRIDAPRCISFLTIEERGPLPHELRPLMGGWVFGCDVCQDVCPYTLAAREAADPDFQPASLDNAYPRLDWLLAMSEAEYRATYAGTAVTRAKRRGLARNAAVVLANSGDPRAEAPLLRALREHDEPLARGHAAWALRRLLDDEALKPLRTARAREHDTYVQFEVDVALGLRSYEVRHTELSVPTDFERMKTSFIPTIERSKT
jgi:epoxyqueuosine reductase